MGRLLLACFLPAKATQAIPTLVADPLSVLNNLGSPKAMGLISTIDVDGINGKVTNTDENWNGTPTASPSPAP